MSTSPGAVSPYKLASVLLQYPTTALFEGIAELDAAAAQTSPRASREAFARFLLWLRATPPTEVGQHYVETFDLRRRCALYLTYYRYGDTRKRGMSMLTFKTAYRAAGLHPSDDELPDYLPMVLDFAALAPRGEKPAARAPGRPRTAAARPRSGGHALRRCRRRRLRSAARDWDVARPGSCMPRGRPARHARRSDWSRLPRRST